MSSIKLENVSGSETGQQTDQPISHGTGVMDLTSTMTEPIQKTSNFQVFAKTDLNQALERGVQILNHQFTNLDNSLNVSTAFKPWGLLLANPFFADKIKDYTYISGTIQVIGVVNAGPMCYGKYAASALPNLTQGQTVSPNLIAQNCMQVDHCFMLDMASSDGFCFQLPWVSDRGKLAIEDADLANMWSIFFTCLQPIGTAVPGGVSVCNLKVYASLLSDYELVIPRFQAKHKLIANETMKKLAPGLHASVGEGKGSAMANTIADVAEMVSKVPVVGAFAGPVSAVARAAAGVLDFFGFTRDSDEKTPTPFYTRSVTNVARLDGTDASEIAALSITNSVTYDPAARGFDSKDCMSFADLCNRWTLIKVYEWNMSMNGLDFLGTAIPVTPSYCMVDGGIVSNDFHLTTAGFVALPFAYWRAPMEYKIVIPVSKMHRGSLQIIWAPIGSTPFGDTDVTNRSLNRIIDVNAETEITLSVGFNRDEPYLQNRLCVDGMAIFPVGSTNGFLFFRVVNPLVAQTTTADTRVFVFARTNALEIAMPRDNINGVIGDTFSLRSDLVLQGKGASGDDLDRETGVSNVLVPDPGAYPGMELHWGEKVTSVRALMQKPSQIETIEFSGDNNLANFVMPRYYMIPGQFSDVVGLTPYFTWMGYYRALFYGISGSERFKLFPDRFCWLGVSRTFTANSDTFVPTLAPMSYSGPHNGYEVVVPFYYPRKFLPAYSNIETPGGVGIKTFISIVGLPSATINTKVVPYVSAGPDISVTSFRQVPLLTLDNNPDPAKTWWT